LERMSREDQDVSLRMVADAGKEFGECARLIEGLAPRDREAVGCRNPRRDRLKNFAYGGLSAVLSPSVDRDATRTTDRASLKPDTDATTRPKSGNGKV